jgi:hypothetical protein
LVQHNHVEAARRGEHRQRDQDAACVREEGVQSAEDGARQPAAVHVHPRRARAVWRAVVQRQHSRSVSTAGGDSSSGAQQHAAQQQA